MIARKAPERAPRQEEARFDRNFSSNFSPSVGSTMTSDVKRSNRAYVIAVAFALIAFTGGILAGMQLAKFRALEDDIVKYPDGAGRSAAAPAPSSAAAGTASGSGSMTSLANAAPRTDADSAADANMGRYLIKIGTFEPEDAERLAGQLNAIRELDPVRPLNCKHVTQTVPGRRLAFTYPLSGDGEQEKKNVFVGCFADQEQAGAIRNVIGNSGLPGTSQAKLYEIQ